MHPEAKVGPYVVLAVIDSGTGIAPHILAHILDKIFDPFFTGYRVLTANDRTEALAHYAQHLAQINAVITDMAMPFMDGQATIRALQRMNPHVKIIATSGFVEHSNITELARNGPVSFLQKPFTTENLLARLISILSGGEPESANDPPLSKPSI